MTECTHRRRLWVVSPGLRVACPFGFCDDCGQKLEAAVFDRIVKEAYPDRPLQRSYADPDRDLGPTGWELACESGWVTFLYPSKLVDALLYAVAPKVPVPYGESFLPEDPK